jgi:methylated-DNA-[protein]-cysteine S-methyltransferase
MYYATLSSPIGNILLSGDKNGLHGLNIILENRKIEIPENWIKNDNFFTEEIQSLQNYFKGIPQNFSTKLKIAGTPFQKAVWRTMQTIPYGTTQTYKDIAIKIGNPKAVRAVGMACNKNPIAIIIPCHRVIGTNSLGGFAGGLEMKKSLLKLEKS